MKPENPEGIKATTHDLVEHLKEYVNTRIDILKLQAIDKSSKAIGAVVLYASLFLLGMLVIILASIGAALFLNQVLDSNYCGFLVVAGFYLLLAIIVYAGRDKLVNKLIREKMVEQMLKD